MRSTTGDDISLIYRRAPKLFGASSKRLWKRNRVGKVTIPAPPIAAVTIIPREILGLDPESARAELLERLKFQVGYSEAIIKSLILVNGGAMVALFTLIGSASTAAVFRFDTKALWAAFALFAAGLALTLLAAIGGFFSQGFFYGVTQQELWMAQEARLTGCIPKDERPAGLRRGQAAQYAGVACAILSTACFSIGAGVALSAVL